jgi:hypothetical protein
MMKTDVDLLVVFGLMFSFRLLRAFGGACAFKPLAMNLSPMKRLRRLLLSFQAFE